MAIDKRLSILNETALLRELFVKETILSREPILLRELAKGILNDYF